MSLLPAGGTRWPLLSLGTDDLNFETTPLDLLKCEAATSRR